MNAQILAQLQALQTWISTLIANLKKIHQFTELTDLQEDDSFLVSRAEVTYKMKASTLNDISVKDKTLNVGAVATDIQTHINANDSTEWNLSRDTTYFFVALINGLKFTYLYEGAKPKYLGASHEATAVSSDFKLHNVERFYIEGGSSYGFIQKGSGTDQGAQELSDKIFDKTLPDGTYLIAHEYFQAIGTPPEDQVDNYRVLNIDM
jgi:hypothetical protein